MARESSSTWVHLNVDEIEAETEKAFLLCFGKDKVWVPKSVISDVDDYDEGDTRCTISVKEWFADKEGLGKYVK